MRPDTPAENVDHNAEAARLERTAELYPEDAEHLLVQAAAHLELAGDRARAKIGRASCRERVCLYV